MATGPLRLGHKLVVGGIVGTCVGVYVFNASTYDLQDRRYKDMVRLLSSGEISNRNIRIVDGQVQIAQSLQDTRPSFAPRPFFDNVWTPKFVQQNLVLNRKNLQDGRWYTLLTCGFSHANLFHLSANMIGFWSMAPSLIATIGSPAFLSIWVASGLLGGAASIWGLNYKLKSISPTQETTYAPVKSAIPADVNFLGASASVLGLFATASVLFPHTKIGILFIPYGIPAQKFIGAIFIGSLVAESQGWLSGTGHLGHAGGIVIGTMAGHALRRSLPIRGSLMILPLLAYALSDQDQLASGEAQALPRGLVIKEQ